MGARAGLLVVSAVLGLGVAVGPAHAGVLGDLGQALSAELGLTRQAVAIEESLAALEHQQVGAEHSAALLEHAGKESLRLLDAYRTGRVERERVAKLRARAMLKASRGGVARLVFEDQATDGHDGASRVSRGRDLRWLVRHDLRELTSYQRSEQRARDELLSAHRQLQALSALATVHAVQADLIEEARAATGAALSRAHQRSRRELSITPPSVRHGEEAHAQLVQLGDEGQRLRTLKRGDTRLHRPVRGRVVGTFGEYVDPVLKLPMVRNGVELAARRDEDVEAPADGTVAMVATLPGFEQVVVIDHGTGQMSMLGRLWKTVVEEGDTVEAGQVIAEAAPKIVDDGLGTTVYFELRQGEGPVDPVPQLRGW